MAEVVMDDMAIGNPVSPVAALLWRFWASFPGIHIAQFRFQVIGNCGVISLMQCSKGVVWFPSLEPALQLPVGEADNMTVSWRLRHASILCAAQG
jgi:hypothetical protein